jgi:alpha-aminoadipic semialdehyde synthase
LQSSQSHRYLSTNQNNGFTVGILRETYDKWERRAPLTPDHISSFLKDHRDVNVLVQPSSQRIFPDVQYQAAGATIQESLQDANVILGVKRPKSLEGLPESSTCMFFSHVIKGQPENMDLLEDCLNKRVQLIDYECIHENYQEAVTGKIKKKRLVGFGKYAGIAAMIDSFSILGRRLLGTYNTTTPFLICPPSIYHPNLEAAKRSVQILGERITTEGLPSNLDPIVVCITGTGGNVHSGVREILELVPHEIVEVDDLPHLKPARHQLYVVTPEYHDLYRHTENGSFDRDDFSHHPQNYTCKFSNSIAPYIHVLMNCIYWDERYPRLLTKDDMLRLYDLEQKRYANIFACFLPTY